jgi:hypothetical protein
MSEESDRQSVFEAWLREKGLEEHPIRCNIFPSTGRGAEATRDIEVCRTQFCAYFRFARPLRHHIDIGSLYTAYNQLIFWLVLLIFL